MMVPLQTSALHHAGIHAQPGKPKLSSRTEGQKTIHSSRRLTLNVSYSRVTQLAWGHAVSYLSYVFWCQSHLVLGTAS